MKLRFRHYLWALVLALLMLPHGTVIASDQQDLENQVNRLRLLGVIHSASQNSVDSGQSYGLAIIKNMANGRTYYLREGDAIVSANIVVERILQNSVSMTGTSGSASALLSYDGRKESAASSSGDAQMSSIDIQTIRDAADRIIDSKPLTEAPEYLPEDYEVLEVEADMEDYQEYDDVGYGEQQDVEQAVYCDDEGCF